MEVDTDQRGDARGINTGIADSTTGYNDIHLSDVSDGSEIAAIFDRAGYSSTCESYMRLLWRSKPQRCNRSRYIQDEEEDVGQESLYRKHELCESQEKVIASSPLSSYASPIWPLRLNTSNISEFDGGGEKSRQYSTGLEDECSKRCTASYVTWLVPSFRRKSTMLIVTLLLWMLLGITATASTSVDNNARDKDGYGTDNPPVPDIDQQPRSQTLSYQDLTTVTCGVTPHTAQVRWLYNGQPLDLRRHPGLEMVGTGLRFLPLQQEKSAKSDDVIGGVDFGPDQWEREIAREASRMSSGSARGGRIDEEEDGSRNEKGRRGNAGEYRCTATTAAGTVVSQPAILSLPVLDPFPQGEDLTLEAPEGGYVTLTCVTPHSVPSAEVMVVGPGGRELRGGERFSGGTVHQLASGSLVLSDLTAAATGTYRCLAMNTALGRNVTSSHVTTLTVVKSNDDSTTRLLPGPRRTVRAVMGSSVTLECPSLGPATSNGYSGGASWTGSRHSPRFVWSKAGGSLPAGRSRTDRFGNLVIQSVDSLDGGTYSCHAHNSHSTLLDSAQPGSNSHVTTPSHQEVVLELSTPPVAKMVRQPDGAVAPGASVKLGCFIGGYPTPEATWYHNGRRLVEADGQDEISLREVTFADAGVYQCMATNEVSSDQDLVRLVVQEPPVVQDEDSELKVEKKETPRKKEKERQSERGGRRKDRKKMGGRRRDMKRDRKTNGKKWKEKPKYKPSVPSVDQLSDSSVKLSWTVPDRGNGQTIKFFKIQFKKILPVKGEWKTDNEQLTTHTRNFELSGLEPGDTYKFRVLAVYEDNDNKESDSTEYKLRVMPPMEPQPPRIRPIIVKVEPVNHENRFGLGITWHLETEIPNKIEGYLIEYKTYNSHGNGKTLTLPGKEIRKHIIQDLEPNTDYTIQMKSFNSAGVSELSNVVNGKTKERDGRHPTLIPPPTNSPPPTPEDDGIIHPRSSDSLGQPIILCIAIGVLVCVLVPLVVMCLCKYRRQKRRNLASSDQKFQEQTQCFLATGADHSNLKQAQQGMNGGLYPTTNTMGGLPGGSGQGQNHMNVGVNPLSEYDLQTSAHGSVANSNAGLGNSTRSKQYFSNGGVNSMGSRYTGPEQQQHLHACNNNPCQQQPHMACHGDMAYMEQQQQQQMHPMHQQRTLPHAPTPHSFYSEANSLGRLPSHSSSTVNHDYSEPGDHHDILSQQQQQQHQQQHRPGMVPLSSSAAGLALHHHHQHQQQQQQQHPHQAPQPPSSLPPQQPPPPSMLQHQLPLQQQQYNHAAAVGSGLGGHNPPPYHINHQMMNNDGANLNGATTFSNPNAIINCSGANSVIPVPNGRSGSVGSIGTSRTYDQAWGGTSYDHPRGSGGGGGTLGRNTNNSAFGNHHPHHPHHHHLQSQHAPPHLSERLSPTLLPPSAAIPSSSTSSTSSSTHSPSKTVTDFHPPPNYGGSAGPHGPLPSAMHPHGIMAAQFSHPGPAMLPPSSSVEFGPGVMKGRHHKRRKKRGHAKPGNHRGRGPSNNREMSMKDQATNTDLSSNEGTFEFRTFAQGVRAQPSSVGGSSISGSDNECQGHLTGSEVEDTEQEQGQGLYHYCDSSFANHGSMESLEDNEVAEEEDVTSVPVSSGDEDEDDVEGEDELEDDGNARSSQHHPHHHHHHHHHQQHHLHHPHGSQQHQHRDHHHHPSHHHPQQHQYHHRQQQTSPTTTTNNPPTYHTIFPTPQQSHVPVPL